MKTRKTGILLMALVLLLALAGCGKASYEISFDENGFGTMAVKSYTSEEALLTELQGDSEEPVTVDYEAEGLAAEDIDGEKYISSAKEFKFHSAKELEKALKVPVTDEEGPIADLKNDLGDDIGLMSYSMYAKDGCKYFRLVYSNPQESMMPEEDATPGAILDTIESYRMMLVGDSAKVTVRAVLGVEVEGDCKTADISKGHATLDFYEELNAWLDRFEAAVKAGEEFTEPQPQGFTMTGCIMLIKDLPFKDVADNTWYKDPVFKAYAKGLIEGTSWDRFSPDSQLTHAQAITLACRLREVYEGKDLGLEDGESIWYQPYLDYAKTAGITDGRSDDIMNEPVTREEMAFYFSRALPKEFYAKTAENELTDIADSEYQKNIAILAESGIVDGYADKSFKPGKNIKRCEAASILAKMIDKL